MIVSQYTRNDMAKLRLVFPLKTKLIEFFFFHFNDFQILAAHVLGEVEAESEDDEDDDDDCKKGSMDEVCDLEPRFTTIYRRLPSSGFIW